MKKVAAFIIAFCLVLVAAAPVVVKAAADDLYYITYQANIGNQELVDLGIVQNTAVGSVSYYMVNNQIQAYNDLQLPVDLSDWDYYMITGANTWQGANFNDIAGISLVVYNSGSPLLCYKASPSLSQFYFDNASYKNGTYSWSRGSFTFYGENIKDLQENGDFKIFSLSGDNWSESSYAFYNNLSIQVSGSFIASTNQPLLYAGEDIAKNSTVSVSNGYDLTQVKQWLADGVNNSESIIDYFQVTKDGVNYDSWGDAFGGGGANFEDLSLNEGFGFSQFECLTMYDGSRDPELSLRSSWALNVNTMDFDSIDLAGATYGIHYDAVLNYRVTESADRKVYKPILGGTYSGTIYSSWDSGDMTVNEIKAGSVTIPLRTIFGSDTAEAVGTDGGAGAMILIDTALNQGRSSVFGNPSFLGTDLVSVYEAAVDYAGALGYSVQAVAGVIVPTTTYYLDGLNIQLSATPYIKSKNQKGVLSQRTVDYLSGATAGFTSDLKYFDHSNNSDQITIDGTKYPTEYQYTTPSYDPSGRMNYIVVDGSPSNAYGGNGGNGGTGGSATANNYVQFESGIKGLTDRFLQEEAGWNRSWWSVFGVFEDNPASELYSTYFSWLPPEFLQFILDIAAVVFLVGAARFIRRG